MWWHRQAAAILAETLSDAVRVLCAVIASNAAYGIGLRVTRYLVDDLNPTGYAQVVEEVVVGAVEREYTYGFHRVSQNQIVSSTWTPSFYEYDGAETVRQLTSITGAVTDAYEYDAWGNKINSTGTTLNNYFYRAEQYDSDLGLYYLRARYYNPLTGRFLSGDPEDGVPTDPVTLHKYNYAGGDPINLADPTGRAQTKAGTGGGDAGQYAGLVGAALSISLGYNATHPGAVKALGQELVCDFELLGSDALALVQWGVDTGAGKTASIQRTDECHVKEKKTCHRGPVYRIYGGNSPLWGSYWTYTDPGSVPNWFNAAGVGTWNAGTDIALGDLVNPEGCECGPAESATDEDGTVIPGNGTDQVVCPNPKMHIDLIGTGKTAKGWGHE